MREHQITEEMISHVMCDRDGFFIPHTAPESIKNDFLHGGLVAIEFSRGYRLNPEADGHLEGHFFGANANA